MFFIQKYCKNDIKSELYNARLNIILSSLSKMINLISLDNTIYTNLLNLFETISILAKFNEDFEIKDLDFTLYYFFYPSNSIKELKKILQKKNDLLLKNQYENLENNIKINKKLKEADLNFLKEKCLNLPEIYQKTIENIIKFMEIELEILVKNLNSVPLNQEEAKLKK